MNYIFKINKATQLITLWLIIAKHLVSDLCFCSLNEMEKLLFKNK